MVKAWYDPTNHVVSTDKHDPRFTSLGQLLPLVPKREWVGLTYEDFVVLLKEVSEKSREMLVFDAIDSLREAIEAKLKEKNT